MKKVLFIVFLSSAIFANAQSPTFQWAEGMGGGSKIAVNYGRSMAVDVAGNVYTTGDFWGTVDFDPSSGIFNLTAGGNGADIFISKFDASGNFVWAKQMGGTQVDNGLSIAVDRLGNVYTTGYFMDTADFDPGAATFNLISSGDDDIFISKLDASGNFIWAKSMGGAMQDDGYSIAVDTMGNVYTTGVHLNDTVDFDPGSGTFNLPSSGGWDIFVSKLNSSGNFVWAKNIMGSGTSSTAFGYSIALDGANNVYTTGYFVGTVDFDPSAGIANLSTVGFNDDVFISKLDVNGNFVWAKKMGGYGSTSVVGYSIAVDANDNVYSTGSIIGVADFDPGSGTFNLISSNYGMFISKLDASGNFVWAKKIGGTSDAFGASIAVDATSNVYTTGSFSGRIDFDPNTGVDTITSNGSENVFISKLDASGNFAWAESMGVSGASINGASIAVDGFSNVYTTGYFQGTVDFDPTEGVFNLSSAGVGDIYVLKLNQPPSSINEYLDNKNVVVYPNPTNGNITIEFENRASDYALIEIKNILGQTIYSEILKNATGKQIKIIDVSAFSDGVYFVQLKNNDGIISKKFIKE